MSAEKTPDFNTQELALKRTAWAAERTRLANERTLVAWLRTGLAVTAFGAVVPRLLSSFEPGWLINLVSVMFVVSGSLVVYFGVQNYREMTNRMEREQIGIQWWLVALLSGTIQAGAIMILILFLLS